VTPKREKEFDEYDLKVAQQLARMNENLENQSKNIGILFTKFERMITVVSDNSKNLDRLKGQFKDNCERNEEEMISFKKEVNQKVGVISLGATIVGAVLAAIGSFIAFVKGFSW